MRSSRRPVRKNTQAHAAITVARDQQQSRGRKETVEADFVVA